MNFVDERNNIKLEKKKNTFNRLSGEFNSWKNTLGMSFFPNIPLANALALAFVRSDSVCLNCDELNKRNHNIL
jgi:hypothetical protein